MILNFNFVNTKLSIWYRLIQIFQNATNNGITTDVYTKAPEWNIQIVLEYCNYKINTIYNLDAEYVIFFNKLRLVRTFSLQKNSLPMLIIKK